MGRNRVELPLTRADDDVLASLAPETIVEKL